MHTVRSRWGYSSQTHAYVGESKSSDPRARDDFPFPRFIDPPSYTNKLEPPSPRISTETSKEIHLWTGRSPLSLSLFLLFYLSFLPSLFLRPFLFSFHPSTLLSGITILQMVCINVPVASKRKTRGSKITCIVDRAKWLILAPASLFRANITKWRKLFGTSRLIFHRFPPRTSRIEKTISLASQMLVHLYSISSILSFFFFFVNSQRIKILSKIVIK